MKWYHYILIGMLLPLTIWASFRIGLKKGQERPIIAKADTITIVREKVSYKPQEAARIECGTIQVPTYLLVRDTVILPREVVEYRDTAFTAWLSGYRPQLDSIKFSVPQTVITNTVTRDVVHKPKFTFGVQLGVGCQYGLIGKRFDVGPSFGIGVQYNF